MPISLSVPGSPSCHAGRISPLSHSRSDVRTQSPSDLSLFSWIPIDRSPSLFFPVVFYLRWQESWRVDRGCGQRMDGRDRRRGRLCCGARAGGACSCTQACRWWSRVLDGMCRERRELRCHVPSRSWRGVLVSRDGNGGSSCCSLGVQSRAGGGVCNRQQVETREKRRRGVVMRLRMA
jgi:hypothetical protein